MGKIAFVFSGQGDQHPGMGKNFYDRYPAAVQIYEMCNRLRPGTIMQCFEGTEKELMETKNTQPCLFAMELAAMNVLLEKGIFPSAVAGFSLGEVVAATASGIFDNETGFRLVCRRGELMQRAAEEVETTMVAVVKLTAEQVQKVCDKYTDIYPVNFNYSGQISVAGLSSQMADFIADIKHVGGRAVPLKVKGAFHSPFMEEAANAFAEVLVKEEVRQGNVPLYSNMTADLYTDDIVTLLSKQICSSVQWEKMICNMIADGIDIFIEIGPGKTLTNMIRKINKEVKAVNVMDYLAEVEEC